MRNAKVMEIESLIDREKEAVQELIESVSKSFDLEEVILFGSKARGDYHKYSDIDIMFILREKKEDDRFRMSGLSFDVNIKYDTNIYAAIDYKDLWSNPEYLTLPLPQNIQQDGVLLDV